MTSGNEWWTGDCRRVRERQKKQVTGRHRDLRRKKDKLVIGRKGRSTLEVTARALTLCFVTGRVAEPLMYPHWVKMPYAIIRSASDAFLGVSHGDGQSVSQGGGIGASPYATSLYHLVLRQYPLYTSIHWPLHSILRFSHACFCRLCS